MARPEWKERLKIRTLDLKNLKDEAQIIVEIFNDAWSANWGFVPFTLDEFLSVADGLKYVMPQDGGFMVELDGEAQAFGIVLPNLHEILADRDGTLFPFGLPKIVSPCPQPRVQIRPPRPVRCPQGSAEKGGRRRRDAGLHRGAEASRPQPCDRAHRVRLGSRGQCRHASSDRTLRRADRQGPPRLRKTARRLRER